MCEALLFREHRCSIERENDVIDLDIPGKDLVSRLKRWWYDLFLLSPADICSRQYYTSSYSILSTRKIHFRYNRGIIHPFSKFRNFWDCLILHALVIHMTVFHSVTSMIYSPSMFSIYLMVGIEYLLILDLFINMRTGYILKSRMRVIINPADIFMHYMTTYSFLHAMCAIPVVNLMFLRLGNNMDKPLMKANAFVQVLRIISTIQVIKLFHVSEYWAKDRGSYGRTFTFKFIRIIVVGLLVIMKLLGLLASFSFLYIVISGSDHNFYIASLVKSFYTLERNDYYWYALTMSRICMSFFLFGYSLQEDPGYEGQITAMLTYAVAFLFHFWAAVVVYNYVASESSLDDHVSIARSHALTVLRVRRLPDVLHTKVLKYYDFNATDIPLIETRNTLFNSLTPALKSQMKMSCYGSLVTKIPYFSEWPTEVIFEIVGLLQSETYLDGDVVSSARHERASLAIVEAGLLAAYSGREEVRHFEDGDYFGERSLVGDDSARLTVVALSASVVLLLDKVSFQELMELYPGLFNEFKMKFAAKNQQGVAKES